MRTLRELRQLHRQGANVAQLLRDERGLSHNDDSIIEIAYDLQAGSYSAAAAEDARYAAYLDAYGSAIAAVLQSLGAPASVLEAGVGEATTLASVVTHLDTACPVYGFDLSWSRVACARRWLHARGVSGVSLCTGNLFAMPMADNAIDVVYTSHSIEPNGGQEPAILAELYRVARRYLVLLEPAYELANAEAQARMRQHGYCRGLVESAEAQGMRVLEHRLFEVSANPLNPTAITIIDKASTAPLPAEVLACPQFRTPLEQRDTVLYSPDALRAYPIIDGIPCLRIENGILASAFA